MKSLSLIASTMLMINFISFSQVSKTNSTAGTITGVPLAGAHLDRTFTYTAPEFGGCSSLTEVEISIRLVLGSSTTPCTVLGGYGVHEDLNVRLTSPSGTNVDLVMDRWGYTTGDPTQTSSFHTFPSLDATVNFDDDHGTNIETLNNWQAGSFAPHNPLSAFDGENPVGTWTLRVSDGNSQFGANDFVCFVTATLDVTCGSGLPVELSAFNASKVEAETVLLTWETASELNNDYFAVERSNDLMHWMQIERQSGAGTSNELQKYQFKDQSPNSGDNYYRLRQVDFDGTTTYSDVRKVKLSSLKNNVEIVPNPNVGTFDLILSGFDQQQPISIKISDVNGRIIHEGMNQSLQKESVHLNLKGIQKGIYYVSIEDGKSSVIERFIVR